MKDTLKEVFAVLSNWANSAQTRADRNSRWFLIALGACFPVMVILGGLGAILSPSKPSQVAQTTPVAVPSGKPTVEPSESAPSTPQATPNTPTLNANCPILVHGIVAGGKALEVLQSDGSQSYWVLLTNASQQKIFASQGLALVSYENFIDTGLSMESFQTIRKAVYSAYGGADRVAFVSVGQSTVLGSNPGFTGKTCI